MALNGIVVVCDESRTMELCVTSVMLSADKVLLIHFLTTELAQQGDRKLMIVFLLPDIITKALYRPVAVRGSLFVQDQ